MCSTKNIPDLNKDLPLDIFTKLVVDECKRLRTEKEVLLDEIEEYKHKISVLEGDLRASNTEVKTNASVFELEKRVKGLKEENRNLRTRNNKLTKELYDLRYDANKCN